MIARTIALGILGIISFSAASSAAKEIQVSTAAELQTALSTQVAAGDVVVLAPGTYAVDSKISCTAAGTADAPITVRAKTPLGAVITSNTVELFKVSGAYWRFEDLDIKGVCADDSSCEHAFHVVGTAKGFVLRKNRLADFNAHLKVNAEGTGHPTPDGGLVEGNEIFDSHPRATSNPVTPLNIDNASSWTVRANLIYDFTKAGGVSYGAFSKGGGKNPLFERNLVICSLHDQTAATRIGLSFGGGGQSPDTCAPAYDPNVPCDPEIQGGIMRNNVVVSCSDVGIYLNKAKDTKILHNTLIATTGVDFRYASSTGEAHGNVLTSKIRVRDGGSFTGDDNLMDVAASTFADWYLAPLEGDLRKKGDLSALLDKGTPSALVPDDYCARTRSDGKPDWGALEHSLGDCETTVPPLSGMSAGSGGAGGGQGGVDGGETGSGGAGGAGGQASNGGDDPSSKGGCACHAGGEQDGTGGVPALAAGALLAFSALRRRKRIAA
jgi:MYXO-CTERM domain-containing protein